MNLWIVPASDDASLDNIPKSLSKPVPNSVLEKHELTNGSHAWGARRGPANDNKFEDMRAGDICIFYTQTSLSDGTKKFNWAGRVSQYVCSSDLSQDIWGSPNFEHVYLLAEVWPISISLDEYASATGYQAAAPKGIFRASEESLVRLGNVEAWARGIKDTLSNSQKKEIPTNMMQQISDFVAARGMVFDGDTLARFYAAIRAKPFVILAGNSGTGKSRLVRLFAEACGATVDNDRFHLVAVRPDWNDSGDLIGHLDLNNDFRPGQIFTALLTAHKDVSRPVFVCLDEMNLARVEHYFSDFLSKIESRRRDIKGRVISDPIIRHDELTADLEKRVPQTLHATLAVLRAAGRGIDLPPNLIIVGTVNMDETTHAFSRKVLDRAHTLEIEAGPLSKKPSIANGTPPTTQSIDLNAPFLTASDMLKDAGNASKLERVSKLLDELNDTLSEASLQVAYRTRDEAAAFFIHATAAGLSDQDAEHSIVMQKILPRVQGSSPRLARVLNKLLIRFNPGAGLDADDATKLPDQLLALRRDAAKPALVRKLAGMWLVYIEEGFTSFWIA